MKLFSLLLCGRCGLCGGTARPVTNAVHLLAWVPRGARGARREEEGNTPNTRNTAEGKRWGISGRLVHSVKCSWRGPRLILGTVTDLGT